MLELFGQGLLAIVSGGATGILGIVFQRIFDHWKNKQELDQLRARQDHEIAMKRVDIELMKEEWAQRVKVAQVEGETKRDVADAEAFNTSLASEPKRYSEGVKVGKFGAFLLVLADVVRAIVRPGLTLYLAWIATELKEQNAALMAILDLQENAATVTEMHKQITLTLLYLFVTCVLWWFGTRNKQKPPGAAA